MKSSRIVRIMALLATLALCLPAALAEEIGEIDLYDPSIYIEDGQPTPEPEAAPQEELELEVEEIDEPVAAPEPAEASEAPAAEPTDGPTAAPEVEATAEPEAEPTASPEAEATAEPEVEATAEPEATPEPLLADEDAQVAPAEVAVDLRLGLGEQFPLDGKALLNGATPTGYASDHPEIVAVDPAAGVLTGKALGVAVITVTGAGATKDWVVQVLPGPERLAFPSGKLSLGKGEGRPFAAQVSEGAGAARLKYTSSKPKVVQVDDAGNLTAKKTGTVKITATAYNGAKATCTVKVLKAPSRLKLSAKSGAMSIGETRTLKATLPRRTASAVAWQSSDPGVVAVDASGTLTGLAPGTATVTARTFNNKSASCKVTVLDGSAPTAVTLNVTTLALGKGEKFQLVPAVGSGEAAVYAYSTSKKRVAAVTSKGGLITAKRTGSATIKVTTQNGKTATVKVKVGKAPSKVKLSPSKLTLSAGQTAQLQATLPSGAASAMRWESSDPSVATVDASGLVTAVKGGKVAIRVTTFNEKSDTCQLVVSDVAGETIDIPDPGSDAPLTPSKAQMVANLRKSSLLGGKREAIAGVVQLLMANGFEPAFAAGVGANILAEGTYGLFESSKYISNYKKRPRYFCYLDGGNYYALKNGSYVLSAVYLSQEELDAYTGTAEKKLRFGEPNYYLNNFSGRYVQNVDLNQLEALMTTLADGKWQGKFGLGIVQWTGARTKTLVSFYRKHAGSGSSITAAQVAAAENEMILYDFKGSYAGVYNTWKKNNKANLASDNAARDAGSIVCLRYEVPVSKEAKAVTRGNKAAEIYRVMMGR